MDSFPKPLEHTLRKRISRRASRSCLSNRAERFVVNTYWSVTWA